MNFNSDALLEHLDQDSKLCDSELSYYRVEVLKKTILKKFTTPQRLSVLDREAKAKFRQINDEVANFKVNYTSFFGAWRTRLYDDLTENNCTPYLTVGRAAQFGYCGPGASIGAKQNDFYTKLFCSPLASTSRFLDLHFRSTAPEHWKDAIAANPNASLLVPGSRISTVPKDKNRNRTICVEPSLNMFYQLGAKEILENVILRAYGISIKGGKRSEQAIVNKKLAAIGSRSGKLATIDLKDASDMISHELIRFLLPRSTYDALCTMRCPATWIDGELVELKMFSTMGNGFTFPLMTLIFCALLRVVYTDLQLPFNKDTFGVFGDDIICLNEAYEAVVGRLNEAGFIVNQDKSFHTGFFRESCGGDYYHGHDVRGIYIKEMKDETNLYSCFNRLHLWSIKHGIPLCNTLLYLKGLAKFQPVPRHAGFHEGFIYPRSHLLSPKRDITGALFYRSSEYRTKTGQVGDDTMNPMGALVSALGGYIVDNRIASRSFVKKVRVIKRKTPCWDYSNDPALIGRGLEDSWLLLSN